MKAFWIDTPNARIVEVDYNGDWRTIAPDWLKCELFTTVMLNRAHDVVFVDDEGLINDNPHGWFLLRDYAQPLKGYGLVLGTDSEGESVAPAMSITQLSNRIEFPRHVNEHLIDKTVTVRSL